MCHIERYQAEIDVPTFVANYVDVPRFLKCCEVCPHYGTSWTCPPYDFDPLDFWNSYAGLTLFGSRIIPESKDENLIRALLQEKETLYRELLALERKTPGSCLLSAGCCEFCGDCARRSGEACRVPERLRYSLESLGADVGKTAEELLGIRLQWYAEGQTPEYLVLVCGLLEK